MHANGDSKGGAEKNFAWLQPIRSPFGRLGSPRTVCGSLCAPWHERLRCTQTAAHTAPALHLPPAARRLVAIREVLGGSLHTFSPDEKVWFSYTGETLNDVRCLRRSTFLLPPEKVPKECVIGEALS